MKSFLASAAALTLWAAPALAQTSMNHGSMPMNQGAMPMHQGTMPMNPGATHGVQTTSTGIAEGVVKNGVRTVDMEVTDAGFVPSQVKVQKGQKTLLKVTRKTDRTCATEIVIKDYGINTPLPLNKTVTVALTPKASGEIKYACAMNMIGGVLFVP